MLDETIEAVLAELTGEDAEHSTALLADLAQAVLRRAPDHLLALPPAVIAARLRDALEAIDELGRADDDHPTIRVLVDPDDPTCGVVEVVAEDRPFLLSTVVEELRGRGLKVLGTFHPIVGVRRDEDGRLAAIEPARPAVHRVSAIQVDVARLDGDELPITSLTADLARRVQQVRAVADDVEPMREDIAAAADELASGGADEAAAFLRWLLDDNLVLLATAVQPDDGATDHSALAPARGLLRDDADRAQLLDGVGNARSADDQPLLVFSRTRTPSPVQRRAPIEVIQVMLPGHRAARLLVLGLLTRTGIAAPVRETPVLRQRFDRVLEQEDIVEASHEAITLAAIAQAIPKDELLRASSARCRTVLIGLLQAEEQQHVHVEVCPHAPSGTISVLLAIPRQRWRPELERRVRAELRRTFDAVHLELDTPVDLRHQALTRVIVHLPAGADLTALTAVARRELPEKLLALARPWEDAVRRALTERPEGTTGPASRRRLERLLDRLPATYRTVTAPATAAGDLLLLDEALHGEVPLVIGLRPAHEPDEAPVRLVAAKRGDTLELSSLLPILESLGLTTVDEVPHRLAEADGPDATLHDVGVRARHLDPHADGPRVAAAILAAWHGNLEVDAINELVLAAGLDWQDVQLLRAYRRLRRHLGSAYTPRYVDRILVDHPRTIRALLEHLRARFDPERPAGADDEARTRARVIEELDHLERLDHDRILRRLLELIDATVRINVFRDDARGPDGEPYVSIKYDPAAIEDAPSPRPAREIFVHSSRVEGVHLRSGAVSRGGLRWSDRRDDVRTEVLDLLKAQILKNAVIVPSGAKGGFVLTREPDDPAARAEEARRQYVTFIRGLLDVTDDLVDGELVGPPGVVRHDGDDPYLVVAADRGTASFSDLANEIAASYGFWLDDAFASGGANGYDHKQLGVTARGAWVAVTAHFRELGIDAQRDPVTVVGIGDMSGDVFGNGLRRSRSVRLIAAFDHRHIFLDPDPDPERSFEERERLYHRPRSSWDDYDRDELSPGGLIVPRTARQVRLTEEVRELLAIDDATMTPPALIRAVLTAPVDLLFAGGIGTYVRASDERDEELGDRANADVRVTAGQVRARVIGEGANLALTQRSRIELARRGTLLNQDAVDNAAGVATSDLEVNLKILLRAAEERGQLTREERNELLEALAEDVVAEALSVVDRSHQAISREVERSPRSLETYDTLLTELASSAGLDRDAELLPSSAELQDRAARGAGLSRPELATLLAWARRRTKEAIAASSLPDHPLAAPALHRALPARVVTRFGELLYDHRLRRELITTVVTNELIDRLGVGAIVRLEQLSGRSTAAVVEALLATRAIVGADEWWAALDALRTELEPSRHRELELPLEELVTTLARVLLTDPMAPSPAAAVDAQRSAARALLDHLDTIGTPSQRRARSVHIRWLVDDLVEPSLARFLASARDLQLVPDVAAVRAALEEDPGEVVAADTLLRLSENLGVDRIEEQLRHVRDDDGWARRERLGLAMDLRRARRAAACRALGTSPLGTSSGPGAAAAAVERFVADRAASLAHVRRTLAAATDSDSDGASLAALGVAVRTLREAIERPVSD